MADPPRSPSTDSYNILGISKNASILDVSKAYKSLVRKWHPDRNHSNPSEAEAKFATINEAYKAIQGKKQQERAEEPTTSAEGSPRHHRRGSHDEGCFSRPSFMSKSTSRRNHASMPMAGGATLSRSTSRASSAAPTGDFPSFLSKSTSRRSGPLSPASESPSLSKVNTSRRSPAPIVFSQSTMSRKALPIEKKLSCTLEELCSGYVKKIKITRDVITSTGTFSQEEEVLKIKVKPGWRKGTKITFDGKGDVRPGTLPADIVFAIDEKRHPLFKREGDDLEIGVEVQLVQALTGCTISLPLLGGNTMSLSLDDIIHPGAERVVPGQGMPLSKEKGKRGDLRLKFLVNFPTHLSEEQRSEVCSILTQSSSS